MLLGIVIKRDIEISLNGGERNNKVKMKMRKKIKRRMMRIRMRVRMRMRMRTKKKERRREFKRVKFVTAAQRDNAVYQSDPNTSDSLSPPPPIPLSSSSSSFTCFSSTSTPLPLPVLTPVFHSLPHPINPLLPGHFPCSLLFTLPLPDAFFYRYY